MKILYRKDKKLTLSNVDGFINIYKSDYSRKLTQTPLGEMHLLEFRRPLKKKNGTEIKSTSECFNLSLDFKNVLVHLNEVVFNHFFN